MAEPLAEKFAASSPEKVTTPNGASLPSMFDEPEIHLAAVGPQNKMRLPNRSVVCWTGGKKRMKKRAAPGYKLQKRMRKQFPQKAKSEISNPVGPYI